MDTLIVNAALWNLLKEQDIVASAATVINYGKNLRKQGVLSMEAKMDGGNAPNITGDTGYGNVTVSDDDRKVHEYSFGSHKDRIGHFRVWKGGDNTIYFNHFWKSELDTAGDEPEVDIFRIRYDPQTLELKHFGRRSEKPLFSLWIFHFIQTFTEPIWGSGREDTVITLSITL